MARDLQAGAPVPHTVAESAPRAIRGKCRRRPGIFTLLASWESFLWPLLVASTPDMYTLPLGLAQFAGRFVDRTDLQMAAATMTVLPLLIAFLFMQKRFIEGMATTGMK